MFMLSMGCARLEYPVVTKYRDKSKVKYERVKAEPKARRNNKEFPTFELIVFVVGVVVFYKLTFTKE